MIDNIELDRLEQRHKNLRILQNCNFGKTVLMILVILGHSVDFWNGNWFTKNPLILSPGLCLLSKWINSFHIYAFTLISGYIFAYKMKEGGYIKYLPFLKNKMKRLLVPYVFTAIVWVIPISQYFFRWDIITILKKYFLCENPSQLWFLWMLFDVFAISWPLWKWLSGNIATGLCLSGTLYFAGILGSRISPNIFCIFTACQYILFFFIGIQIRISHEKNNKHVCLIPWWGWVPIYVILFWIVLMIEQSRRFKGLYVILEMLLHIVGALLAFAIMNKLSECIRWQKNKIFIMLLKYSMPMYLFHQQIIYWIISIFNGKVLPVIHAGMNFFFSVIGAFIISYLLMKFRITRYLVGEEKSIDMKKSIDANM